MKAYQSFYDWINLIDNKSVKNKPWLILGKGPTFANYYKYDLTNFNVVALNHAIEKVTSDFVHLIDLDVFDACQNKIYENARYLIVPWIPHLNNRPGKDSIADLIEVKPILNRLFMEGRLLFYNHVPSRRFGSSPLIDVKYFSAEAMIKLLATAGVKKIKTLGVDGGASYSSDFESLKNITLLSNGRKSFNIQFKEIAKTIMSYQIDFAPLDLESPIKVYVATTEVQMLSVKVLEYSIKKHASMSVDIIPLHLSHIEIPKPKDQKNWPRTPFSFQRLIIPEMQAYKGRAIYLDSDMLVFKDIKELWVQPFNNSEVLAIKEPDKSGRNPQFSVLVIDCEKANWDIKSIVAKLDSGDLTYEKLIYEMSISKVSTTINPSWNSLEAYKENETSLLHYTDMHTQPWVSINNPLGYIWFQYLFEAIDEGFITKDYIKDHIDKGYIRPSIMYQIEHRLVDSLLLPKEAKKMDISFSGPFMEIHQHKASPWKSKRNFLKAYIRHSVKKSTFYKFFRKVKAFCSSKQ